MSQNETSDPGKWGGGGERCMRMHGGRAGRKNNPPSLDFHYSCFLQHQKQNNDNLFYQIISDAMI